MKTIKFDLPINGTKVKNLDELRDNLTDEILMLARSSQLERWLRTRQLPEKAQAVATAVRSEGTDKGLFLALCGVLEVEVHPGDVRAIFDAPPAPGRFISGARYFELYEKLKNLSDKKSESEEVILLKKISKISLQNIIIGESFYQKFGESIIFGPLSVFEIYVKKGEKIKKGDLLFKVKNRFELNKIVSSVSGVVQEVFVKTHQEIQFDQYFFSVAETQS